MGREIHLHKNFLYTDYLTRGYWLKTQIMNPQHLLDEQVLAAALPPPQDMLGHLLHGTLMLSHRACSAMISSGAPRTFIRPGFARSVGYHSVPRPGDYMQHADGSWHRVVEHSYPTLLVSVSGIHWRVRAVEGATGPFDLVLGADWLYHHRAVVDIFSGTVSLGAPGGRVILQFVGAPAVLSITGFLPDPLADPVVPPVPEPEIEEEPEEEEPEEEEPEEILEGVPIIVVDDPVADDIVAAEGLGDVID